MLSLPGVNLGWPLTAGRNEENLSGEGQRLGGNEMEAK